MEIREDDSARVVRGVTRLEASMDMVRTCCVAIDFSWVVSTVAVYTIVDAIDPIQLEYVQPIAQSSMNHILTSFCSAS